VTGARPHPPAVPGYRLPQERVAHCVSSVFGSCLLFFVAFSLSRARGSFFLIFSSRFHQLHRFALCFLASAPSFGAQLGFYRFRFHVVSRLLASFVLGGISVCVCVSLSLSLCALSLARFGGWWCFFPKSGFGKENSSSS